MNNTEDDADKPFEATPQKLLEARKKGEIARSTELLTAAAYSGFFLAWTWLGPAGIVDMGTAFTVMIDQADSLSILFTSGASNAPSMGLMQSAALAIAPIFLLPMLAVLAMLFVTRGIVFAPTKIAPKISKISIVSNAKNKFGRTGLFQFAVSFLKLLVYSACLAYFLYVRIDDMVAALATEPRFIVVLLAEICMSFLLTIVIVATVIGGIDALWQHFEHLRKNRMSRKEIMDETKNAEGDPHMKQERRQRAQAIAGNKMMLDVGTADVVVVNPTHYAVALKWERKKGVAPICVAKGVDEIALRIREIAHENGIPIHSDPPTARALHATTKLGEEISPDHYRAVAAAIRFAEKMRQKARHRYS